MSREELYSCKSNGMKESSEEGGGGEEGTVKTLSAASPYIGWCMKRVDTGWKGRIEATFPEIPQVAPHLVSPNRPDIDA